MAIPIRVARALVMGVALLLSAPAFSQVSGALYPLEATGLKAAERARVQRLVLRGLKDAERDGMLSLPRTATLAAECGHFPDIGCMAREAGPGLVIYGEVKRAKAGWRLLLRAVDEAGNVYGPEHLTLPRDGAASGPVEEAVANLTHVFLAGAPEIPGAKALAAVEPPPAPIAVPVAQAPAPAPLPARHVAPSAEQAPRPVPDSLPPRPDAEQPRAPVAETTLAEEPFDRDARARRDSRWKRTAGPVVTAGGLAIFTTGVVIGFLDRNLANSLDEKYQRASLTPEDRASFQRVRTFNTLANVCFVAGALTSAAGIYLWSTAPAIAPRPGGAQLMFGRSF